MYVLLSLQTEETSFAALGLTLRMTNIFNDSISLYFGPDEFYHALLDLGNTHI